MLNRAFAALVVRSTSEGDDKRTFEGVATTPTTDRMGDVVDPMGAKFKNPLPLLHQHDAERPIGHVRFKRATPEGIEFSASIPKIAEPGPLKDRVDTAWGEIKAGLVRAVSIGFRVLQDGAEFVGDGGIHFKAIEIMELSAVTIPANAEATITNIKTFDVGTRAASGLPVVKTSPGVSGSPPKPQARKGAAMPRSASEQIEDFRSTMATKVARMGVIMNASNDSGETMDASQAEEYDGLNAEVDALQAQLKRAENLERVQALTALPINRAVSVTTSAAEGLGATVETDQRTGRIEPVVRSVERLAPGIRMARIARTILYAKMVGRDPIQVAEEEYPNDTEVRSVIQATYRRAAVPAGNTIDPSWAGALISHEGGAVADFIAFLRPQTILGQFGVGDVPDLRRVPFRVPLVGQTSGGQGYWVGEGKAKPITKFDFSRTHLEPLKVASISVLTDELVRFSSPAADVIVRDSLIEALRARLDIDFIDPAKAAVANVSPASVTNGVTGIPSTGVDAAAVRADIKAAYEAYVAGNNALRGGVWIMCGNLAAALGMMVNLLGQPEFKDINRGGGSLGGFPVVTSDYVPNNIVILVNAPEIYLGDEGGFMVDMSREASVEMLDNPVGDALAGTGGAAATIVSLWQENCVGLKAERIINWQKRRPQACVVITGVAWGS
jgi:HK97 family phage prohead protease